MSTPLNQLLAEVIKKYGLERAMLEEQMPRIWSEMVGTRIARIAYVKSFENGVLRVHVVEAVWRAELTLRREELRSQLNTVLGKEVVGEIVFR